MCKKALSKLEVEHKKLVERGQIRIYNEDILNFKVLNNDKNHDFYFIIFLEVLDNMPHDRVYFDEKTQDWTL